MARSLLCSLGAAVASYHCGLAALYMNIHAHSHVGWAFLALACAVLLAEVSRADSPRVAASDPPPILAIVPSAPSKDGIRSPASGYPRTAVSLYWVGPRFGLGGNSPLGEEQKENFQLYDIAALWRLPWSWESSPSSFWRVESRLLGSGGQLMAAGTSSFMGTIVPTAALATRGGAFAVDLGTGVAFFTNSKFGAQDFGGPVQIIATTGISLAPIPGFRGGYRFQHFSDAGIYGPTSLGVDMHLLEMGYLF